MTKKFKGRNYKPGGIVTGSNFIKPVKKIYATPNKDTVKSILVNGELVIPRRYVPITEQLLRNHHISFGNFK